MFFFLVSILWYSTHAPSPCSILPDTRCDINHPGGYIACLAHHTPFLNYLTTYPPSLFTPPGNPPTPPNSSNDTFFYWVKSPRELLHTGKLLCYKENKSTLPTERCSPFVVVESLMHQIEYSRLKEVPSSSLLWTSKVKLPFFYSWSPIEGHYEVSRLVTKQNGEEINRKKWFILEVIRQRFWIFNRKDSS